MRDKILFWIDEDFIHYGISKYLQDNYDCDLFSVVDLLDKPKKFFEKQQLVKFQKAWYYDEHLPSDNEKPDLAYLKSFEEKYGISLSRMIYLDRMFSLHNKFYKVKNDQILSLIERACRFCEDVLDELKPNFFITKMTNMHHNHLFYETCKARGIHVLMLVPDKFERRCMISKESNKFDLNPNSTDISKTRTISELQDFVKKYSSQKQTKKGITNFQAYTKKKILTWILKFLFSKSENFTDHFNRYGQTKIRILMNAASNILQRKIRSSFIDRNFITKIDETTPFIYYPLHYEPERLYLIDVPHYDNQIYEIKNIAKSLPIGYKLLVKEHPAMVLLNWRDVQYYKQIMDLPNVQLVHPSISTDEIIAKCSLVISIAGSAGLESAFYKKPSIVFSDVIYSTFPFTYRLKSIEELSQAIRLSLEREVNLSDLDRYLNILEQNSFEFDIVEIQSGFNNWFYGGGVLTDVEIAIPKMISFLENYKSSFDKLGFEHVKKIKQYNETNQKNTL
ncbi:MAG: hypothetical protein WBE60_07810 [Nitrosotalea sp.]